MGTRFDDNVENVLQQVSADGNRHQLERFENLDELEEEDDEEHVEIRGFLVNIIFPHATTTCLWSLHLVFLATYAIVMQSARKHTDTASTGNPFKILIISPIELACVISMATLRQILLCIHSQLPNTAQFLGVLFDAVNLYVFDVLWVVTSFVIYSSVLVRGSADSEFRFMGDDFGVLTPVLLDGAYYSMILWVTKNLVLSFITFIFVLGFMMNYNETLVDFFSFYSTMWKIGKFVETIDYLNLSDSRTPEKSFVSAFSARMSDGGKASHTKTPQYLSKRIIRDARTSRFQNLYLTSMVRLPINLITGYFTLSSMNSKADSTMIATQLFSLLHGFHMDLSEARKRREADLSQETVLEPAPATTTKDVAVLERIASKKEEILDDKVEEEKKKLEPPPPADKPKPPEFAIVPTPLEMAALEGLEKALRDDIPPDTPQKVITSIDLEHDNQLMAEMRARCDVVETEPVEVQLHREVAAEFSRDLNLDELEVASESSGPTLIVESSRNSSVESQSSEGSHSSASTTSLASGTPGVVFPALPSEGQSSISATDDVEVPVEDPNFRNDRPLSTAPPWESPMQADVMHPFRRRRQRSMETKRGKPHGAFHPGLEHVKASKNVAVTTAALDTAVQALAEAEHQAVRQKDPKSQQTIPREFFEKFLTGQELTAFFRQADPGKTNLINENSMQRVLVNMHNTKKSLIRAMDAQLQIQVVFGNLINIILITVTFFVFLVCIGLSPESIIVSGAAVVSSVIVSMSFLYTSFVQSVMLICFVNPFTVGDRLRLGPSQQIHVVRKITTFYTEFVNIEEKIVIYSNASLITEKIVNDSRSRAACFVVHMLVSDLTPAPRIKALRQLVEAYVLARPSEYIHKDYAMIIEAVQPGHYFDLTFYVTYMTSWHKWQAVCAARSAVIQYILKICNVLHIEYKFAVQRWETISAEGEKV